MAFNFKAPTSKEEMDALRKALAEELSDEEIDAVAGGNDDVKGKNEGTPWVCPFCGATVMIVQFQDGAKHMTKDCPNNPYK